MTSPDLDVLADRAIAQLRAAAPGIEASAAQLARCRQIALASDFAIATWCRQPRALAALLADEDAPAQAPPQLDAGNRQDWGAMLRRHRAAESARLVWRDVAGLDDVAATLAGSTRLAEDCLHAALSALEQDFRDRYGAVRPVAGGPPLRLVVFALGKLGGGELNFSSDIDLVLAYAEDGASDGPRPLAAEAYFARLGQELARLLDEVTADGFCHRVDLRLRPFGTAGRVALPFAALEQYFQREGRDWERYAWQKARPVAGDAAAGEAFLGTLRPFVYRRYLDYGALDGLRGMKAAIAAEVARKELADDIKRGPGGIREVEFLAQALQLIRGGREPALRERRLLPALLALRDAGHLAADTVDTLVAAYRFLRRLENRLQMRRDAQTHVLPADGVERARVAVALGYADWDALAAELEQHRGAVAAEFAALLAPRRGHAVASGVSDYWRALPDAGSADVLAAAGFDQATAADAVLRDFARSPGVRDLSDAARARLDRVLPVLLEATAGSAQPLLALRRLLALLQNILRRASYLALLDEQPAALTRLVDVATRSALLAERLARHPLLLDELLDARVAGPMPGGAAIVEACRQALAHADLEAALLALNETRQALSFRIALATLDQRQRPQESAAQLTALADAVIGSVVALARREMQAAHGDVAGSRFAVIGYGSLGGRELGFGSDLDVVFLYDAPDDAASAGARPLEAPRWFARLAQKVVSLLGTPTAAGRLYEVDVRLRPDGAKGLLVSTLGSFADYQRTRAWTWEHQALVRARCVDGDASLCAEFEAVRATTLARPREPLALAGEVAAMRARMRAELDRSDAARFDLKQGAGGLVDLEFLLQYRVLADAAEHARLLEPRDTPGLLAAAGGAGVVPADTIERLGRAHALLLAAGLSCTLDRRMRLVSETPELAQARAAIREAATAAGLA